MKGRSLRAAALIATLAVLFPAAGCMRIGQDIVVFPDGSGKMTVKIGVNVEMMEKLKGMGGNAQEADEKMGFTFDSLDKIDGIVAFARPVTEEKDGWKTTTITAYFEDINKVKFWDKKGEERKEQISFAFKAEGEGHVLEIEDRMLSNGDDGKADDAPDEMKEQIWEKIQEFLKGFEVSHGVKMPGAVTAVEGYATKAGRTASSKVGQDDLKNLDDLGKAMKGGKRKITSGKSEVSDDDKAAFKKEMADAKAEWPKVKEEMKAEHEKRKKNREEDREQDE